MDFAMVVLQGLKFEVVKGAGKGFDGILELHALVEFAEVRVQTAPILTDSDLARCRSLLQTGIGNFAVLGSAEIAGLELAHVAR